MPTLLLLRFPGRRYHATPWGHHVNEGLVEWPPSPWRVLRALLSVGYTRLGWRGDMAAPWRSVPPATALALFDNLTAVLPSYRLPKAGGAHSRHYMPTAEMQRGTERTTLVFDTWAQVEGAEMAVCWPVDLPADQLDLLTRLAGELNYLGRSESWVSARVCTDDIAADNHTDCRPCAEGGAPGPGWEQVALLAPQPPRDYAAWRDTSVARELRALPDTAAKGKAAAKARAAADAVQDMFPTDTMACLQVDTTWLRRYGWSQPPGTRRVLYWRRSDALQAPTIAATAVTTGRPVTAVLLAMASQTLNDHALPAVSRSLPQAELLHRHLLAAFGRMDGALHSQTLSGCDEHRQPLRGAHRHAHILPLDLDADRHIDHVLVWAPHALSHDEQTALRRVRTTFTKGGVGALRLAWIGAGSPGDLAQLPGAAGQALQATLGCGRQWVSATPFIPPRHLKPRGANALFAQVQSELASRGLPPARRVDCLDPHDDERARVHRHFVRVRRFGPPPAQDTGFSLILRFDSDIRGPLTLGYGSHFGMGRFECMGD